MNRSLTESVETLSDQANDALGHLHLILEWWSEFTSNHGDMTSWLGDMEERVTTLEAELCSAVSPRPCPLALQQTAKVMKISTWNSQVYDTVYRIAGKF